MYSFSGSDSTLVIIIECKVIHPQVIFSLDLILLNVCVPNGLCC